MSQPLKKYSQHQGGKNYYPTLSDEDKANPVYIALSKNINYSRINSGVSRIKIGEKTGNVHISLDSFFDIWEHLLRRLLTIKYKKMMLYQAGIKNSLSYIVIPSCNKKSFSNLIDGGGGIAKINICQADSCDKWWSILENEIKQYMGNSLVTTEHGQIIEYDLSNTIVKHAHENFQSITKNDFQITFPQELYDTIIPEFLNMSPDESLNFYKSSGFESINALVKKMIYDHIPENKKSMYDTFDTASEYGLL